MTVFVSMLRGVNVGANSRVKMPALQQLYESLGLSDVQTLLQSGNVVFRSGIDDPRQLARRIVQEIERRLGLQIEVIMRTLAEIESIVDRSPILSPRADLSKLLVMFLSGVPDAESQKRLHKWHQGREMLEIRGPEIYLYYPDGVGRSKLSGAVIENQLNVSGTARNWNTLLKLVAAGKAIEHRGGGPSAQRGVE